MKRATFPPDFLWGASTASHQVEGGTHNQWSEWEKANAERLATAVPETLKWLPHWSEVEAAARQPQNYLSGAGVEHYDRFKEDFDLLEKLHMNAFRFGIEWSRIEPEPGKWDKREIAHYRHVIDELRRRHIEPIPTLWHWTMPVWFAERGGFEQRANLAHFVRFAEKVAQEFGDKLTYLITLNEPNVYTAISYVAGLWPPERKNLPLGLRVMRNLATAHNQAHTAIKRTHPQLQIGIAANMSESRPTSPRNPLNQLVIGAKNYTWNWWFANRIRRHQDFVGLNYYMTSYHNWRYQQHNPSQPINDLGWYMEPSGIHPLLVKIWRRYRKPIIITENGLADGQDQHRQWWLAETITAMQQALADGVELKGYLHWSLLDNFEWAYGWWPQFGLAAVDRRTMKRTLRPSALWLAKEIERYRSPSHSA